MVEKLTEKRTETLPDPVPVEEKEPLWLSELQAELKLIREVMSSQGQALTRLSLAQEKLREALEELAEGEDLEDQESQEGLPEVPESVEEVGEIVVEKKPASDPASAPEKPKARVEVNKPDRAQKQKRRRFPILR